MVSFGEQKLEHELARLHHLFRLGLYRQTFGNLEGTGRLQRLLLFNLHQTHATCADWVECRVVTQHWDVNPSFLSRFEDRLPRFGSNLLTVNGKVY
jgi:hypothetical protein